MPQAVERKTPMAIPDDAWIDEDLPVLPDYGRCDVCGDRLRGWAFERDGVTVLGLTCSRWPTHDPDPRAQEA